METYRQRLISAFDLYQQGGTVPGMILAMELLGYPNAKVAEPRTPRLYDGAYSHTGTIRYGDIVWAVFTVEIETPALSPERLDLILRTIDRWKPAHTMLAYLVLAPGSLADECLASDSALDLAFDHTLEISDLYAWPVAMYDGTHTHGGEVSHNGEMDLLDIEVLP